MQAGAPLTYDEYRSLKYFPALDAMRAYGMLMVVSAHMDDNIWGWVGADKGLTFFFVMSGFLITTLLLREEELRGKISLSAFYIRRICRIFPLYYLVLSSYVVIIFGLKIRGVGKVASLKWALPYYLSYTNEFTIGHHGHLPFAQSWSLGVEEKYYLLWPIMAFILLARYPRVRMWVTGGLAVLFLAIAAPAHWANWYGPILTGCLLAFALHNRAFYERLRVLATRRWNLPIALALLSLQIVTPWFNGFAVHVYSPLLALFLIGAMVGRLPYLNFLRWGAATYVGKRTYGMYLVHKLCIDAVELVLKPRTGILAESLAAYVVSFALSVAVADVLHRLVEQPFIDLGRRWSAKRTAGVSRIERMGAQAAP